MPQAGQVRTVIEIPGEWSAVKARQFVDENATWPWIHSIINGEKKNRNNKFSQVKNSWPVY